MERKIIYISVVLFFLLSGCMSEESNNNPNGITNGITAKKGGEVAKDIAREWDKNSTLIFVSGSSSHVEGGEFISVSYRYWNQKQNETNCIEITIWSDNKTEMRETQKHPEQNPITNWTVDSDEAYEIAKDNKKIKDYLDKYEDAWVDSFFLAGGENDTDPEWWIDWSYDAGMDTPMNARIVINAHTGEVIEAEADN